MEYTAAIGLEIHAELKTETKMFCGSRNDPDEKHPNINICPICMGHPGVLPVVNEEAVKKTVAIGLALNGNIADFAQFDRKNYFYPDLPKGYQISQYQHPLATGGHLDILLPNPSQMVPNESRIFENNSSPFENHSRKIVLKDESYQLMRLLFEIHNKLGPIYKEKNYCDAIEEVLKREKIPYERERKIVLKFGGLEVSDFFADFVVDNKILLEVKAKPFITNHDIRQASRYIKTLGIPLAIIANFKRQRLESKRVINPAFENHSSSFDKDSRKKIRIRRIHLEEDTGRLIHDPKTKTTLIDFNRAGVPLMELVTEPDVSSAGEVKLFGEELQKIFRYLGTSDADMEKGQMRVEVNISLSPAGSENLGTKVELKNINSFKFAADAVDYEIRRQSELLDRGEKIQHETRGWDEKKGVTVLQRRKEESDDYRYFPEPDIPPLRLTQEFIEELRASLPELPSAKTDRFLSEFGLDPKMAATIAADKKLAAFFEAAASELAEWLSSRGDSGAKKPLQLAANYLTTDLAKLLAGTGAPIGETLITPENFAELVTYIYEGRLSSKAAKEVLKEMFASGADPSIIADEKKLWQVSEIADISPIIEKVISANTKAAEDYRAGKREALQFLVGQVMKEVKGANPETVGKLLEERLK